MPDVAEGGIKNNDLYNDKELIDDAHLGWYDYGFRSYDAQIGRFPQLDPLTDDYPYLTPYQYASCEPIGNIDVDGLEGATATVVKAGTNVSRVQTLKSVVMYSSTAGSTGLKLGKAAVSLAIDATQVIKNHKTMNGSKGKSPSQVASWWERVCSGNGSYQDYGYVIVGNANGQPGAYSLIDRAGNIVGYYDLGSLINILSGYSSAGKTDGLISNPIVEKVNEAVEFYNEIAMKAREVADQIDEKNQDKWNEEFSERMKKEEEALKAEYDEQKRKK